MSACRRRASYSGTSGAEARSASDAPVGLTLAASLTPDPSAIIEQMAEVTLKRAGAIIQPAETGAMASPE